ncbi:Similar to spopla: Speckle-type POZ protein-like A (Danio rerio) [Cotesia congregata]|uniref:Similar to spopla: Speckle-type POZ protein-like A (Danio rerio) n=1 Tax=Cotesia congregata TaxID=51543 RepID=A0A8J2HME5_COTCN|nr:Similar to spopla: Speckle-type POZ protein-like A (Danio rerio) [Cotesia congregata]
MSNDTNRTTVNMKEDGGYSYTDEHSIVYKWEINKIESFLRSAKSAKGTHDLDSPEFSAGAKIKDLWYVKLRIQNDDASSENKTWVSIYLNSKNGNRKVQAKYLSGYGPSKFVNINELLVNKNNFLPNDTLTVCVELIVYDEYIAVKNSNNLLEGCKRKLSDDFKDFFETKKKCDVAIKVGDKEFCAHKMILIARSSVFEAMFSHDMKENKENEVTIPDIDPEVFKKVLDYIYTDRVDDLISFAEKLLEAADKYQLQGLKDLCECSLSKTLTPGNAVKILILADRHYAKRLKEVAIDFITNNWLKFKNTKEFKELEKADASLACSVLRKVADKVQN